MKAAVLVCCLAAAPAPGLAGAEMPVAEVAPGIYRGPAPETPADYRQLRSLGVKTVLDVRRFHLRRMEQERECVHAFGMNYVQSPVTFHPHRDGSAERALCTLADVSLRPIYIHCELGRDRVGLIVALYRVRCQGWRPQAAYAEMKCFGFRSYLRGLERYFWEACPSAQSVVVSIAACACCDSRTPCVEFFSAGQRNGRLELTQTQGNETQEAQETPKAQTIGNHGSHE